MFYILSFKKKNETHSYGQKNTKVETYYTETIYKHKPINSFTKAKYYKNKWHPIHESTRLTSMCVDKLKSILRNVGGTFVDKYIQ